MSAGRATAFTACCVFYALMRPADFNNPHGLVSTYLVIWTSYPAYVYCVKVYT